MDAAHQDVRFTPANEIQHRRNYSLPDAPWAWPKIQAWCASHRMPQSAAVIYGFMRHVESAVVNDRLPYEHLSVSKLATLGFADKSPRRLRLYRQCLTDIGLWHVPKRGTIILTDLEKRSTRNGQNTYWLFANIRRRTRDADNARKKLARRQQAAPFIAGHQYLRVRHVSGELAVDHDWGRARAVMGVAKPHTQPPLDVTPAELDAIANLPASGRIRPLAFLKDAEFGTKTAVYCQSTETSASYILNGQNSGTVAPISDSPQALSPEIISNGFSKIADVPPRRPEAATTREDSETNSGKTADEDYFAQAIRKFCPSLDVESEIETLDAVRGAEAQRAAEPAAQAPVAPVAEHKTLEPCDAMGDRLSQPGARAWDKHGRGLSPKQFNRAMAQVSALPTPGNLKTLAYPVLQYHGVPYGVLNRAILAYERQSSEKPVHNAIAYVVKCCKNQLRMLYDAS